jgi:hypothetical protein
MSFCVFLFSAAAFLFFFITTRKEAALQKRRDKARRNVMDLRMSLLEKYYEGISDGEFQNMLPECRSVDGACRNLSGLLKESESAETMLRLIWQCHKTSR